MSEIKILITGSDGQLGQCILENIKFNRNRDNISYTAVNHGELDITDLNQVKKELSVTKYDYLINCAAYTNVADVEIYAEEPALLINGYGPKVLAECCAETGTKLIHISTDYVYDNSTYVKYETTEPNPLNKYGRSKLLGEQEILSVAESGKLDYMIIRTAGLYSEYGTNFVKTIFNKLISGQDCSVVYDQITSPTNAHHLAEFIINEVICKNNFGYGIYNYTDMNSISWYDLAATVYEFLACMTDNIGKLYPVETDADNTSVKRPMINILSKQKVIEKYGRNVLYDSCNDLINVLNVLFRNFNEYGNY